jgi:diguanylate cyclase (GGDEF)-like protein/PAS domain S-box-containing protein
MVDDMTAGAALKRLLEAHPEAVVGALDTDGSRVEPPSGLGFRHPPDFDPDAPTGLEVVAPGDRGQVLRAYDRARRQGAASAAARTVTGQAIVVHFLDLREEHGCVLIVTVLDDGTVSVPDEGDPAPPRVTWGRLDAAGRVLELDDSRVQLFGWTREEVVGAAALPFIHPDDHERAIDNWLSVLAARGESRRYRCRHRCRDGSWLWVEVTNLNRLEDPEHGDVLTESVDISDEMAVHDTLREREQLLRQLTDALPVGVVQFGADRATVHENEQLAAIVGACGLEGLLAAVVGDEADALGSAIDATLAGEVPAPMEVRLVGERVCRVTLRPLADAAGEPNGGLACIDDVTEAAQLRHQLELRAMFDQLTSCLNRSAILTALDGVAGDGPGTGVVFVDLDRFKPVNDLFGHAAGDELLATVGERLRQSVRDVDLVGRLGGDEFLVVCPGVDGLDAVQAIAERIMARFVEPFGLAVESVVRPRASIGVAWAPAGTDPAALVALADAAMYEAKRASRHDQATTGS